MDGENAVFSLKYQSLIGSIGRCEEAPLRFVARSASLISSVAVRNSRQMEKSKVYLGKEEMESLRDVAARSGRSASAVVREAIRRHLPQSPPTGPVAIWHGELKRSSMEHDDVYDEGTQILGSPVHRRRVYAK